MQEPKTIILPNRRDMKNVNMLKGIIILIAVNF